MEIIYLDLVRDLLLHHGRIVLIQFVLLYSCDDVELSYCNSWILAIVMEYLPVELEDTFQSTLVLDLHIKCEFK